MRRSRFVVLACAMSAAYAGAAGAQDDSGRAILQKAADYAGVMTMFTVDFELLFDAIVDGETENFTTDYTVALRQPGDAMIHMNNRFMELWQYTSASATTRYLPEMEQDIVEVGGTKPSDLMRSASNNVILPAVAIFAELMKPKPLAGVLSKEDPITLVGQETVNGVECDRVRFQYSDFACEVWIDRGEEALVHRIRPDMTGISDGLAQQGLKVDKFLVQLDVLHWQPNLVDESLLTYTPKDGAEKVARFYRPQPASAADELVGKVAPDISLKLLDGTPFDLASKKGKEIVVLDFWATWCGPCRKGMPILSKVTKEFADKGVRLYAVNLEESPDQVKGFLESTGLDVTVVMDTTGKMGSVYKAESIPQMVIIGRDGVVKKVHIGVTPNHEEEIRAELTELTQ